MSPRTPSYASIMAGRVQDLVLLRCDACHFNHWPCDSGADVICNKCKHYQKPCRITLGRPHFQQPGGTSGPYHLRASHFMALCDRLKKLESQNPRKYARDILVYQPGQYSPPQPQAKRARRRPHSQQTAPSQSSTTTADPGTHENAQPQAVLESEQAIPVPLAPPPTIARRSALSYQPSYPLQQPSTQRRMDADPPRQFQQALPYHHSVQNSQSSYSRQFNIESQPSSGPHPSLQTAPLLPPAFATQFPAPVPTKIFVKHEDAPRAASVIVPEPATSLVKKECETACIGDVKKEKLEEEL